MADLEVARALEVIHDLSAEDKESLCRALGHSRRSVTDTVWLVTVSAFVAILISSFAAVVLFVYQAKDAGIVLAMFTAVLGYLAGLISPSPVSDRR